MANLKNITDLPIIESADGVNLIVNDNGSAKQIAAGAVGAKSWNDLEDKPFGVKTEMVEIVPEQSVTGVWDEDIFINDKPPFLPPLKDDTNYIVIFNGDKHVCKSDKFIVGDRSTIQIDGSFVDDAHTRPLFSFAIYIQPTGQISGSMLTWDETINSETITIAIYEEQEVVTPIDIKYLPIEELKIALGIG